MKRLKAILGVIHAWLESVAGRGAPYVERVLGRLPNKEEIEVVDFASDADLAMLRQEPLRARV
ncbi:MAG: HlyD family type I secretion periplasmic adaptor subunit, partial [Dechloromonas sp.]|nr:HlyD family type I secretion periplasmic adaptor subunit [Dechloromonas sp.]